MAPAEIALLLFGAAGVLGVFASMSASDSWKPKVLTHAAVAVAGTSTLTFAAMSGGGGIITFGVIAAGLTGAIGLYMLVTGFTGKETPGLARAAHWLAAWLAVIVVIGVIVE
ncbi:MAG: hypothetical protein AAFX08_10445 [Pseudomonadota bacterium]